MPPTNRQIRLAARPQGELDDSVWELTEEPAEEPGDGQVLLQNLSLSLDPAMRGWLNDVRSYVPPVGIGEVMSEISAKKLDIQIGTNLRGLILATREGLPMLKEAGAEHGKALIVNTASIAGKKGQGWLSVYSATKAGVVGFSQATQQEHENDGIQVTALCPGFVDTPMTEFVKGQVPAEEMIRPEDIAESVRFLMRVSPACVVPEIMFVRPGDQL